MKILWASIPKASFPSLCIDCCLCSQHCVTPLPCLVVVVSVAPCTVAADGVTAVEWWAGEHAHQHRSHETHSQNTGASSVTSLFVILNQLEKDCIHWLLAFPIISNEEAYDPITLRCLLLLELLCNQKEQRYLPRVPVVTSTLILAWN